MFWRQVAAGVALGLSLAFVPPAAAQDYMASMRQKAERGDAPAQLTLGFMYSSGLDVPQDYAEAAKWYRKAADQG